MVLVVAVVLVVLAMVLVAVVAAMVLVALLLLLLLLRLSPAPVRATHRRPRALSRPLRRSAPAQACGAPLRKQQQQ